MAGQDRNIWTALKMSRETQNKGMKLLSGLMIPAAGAEDACLHLEAVPIPVCHCICLDNLISIPLCPVLERAI